MWRSEFGKSLTPQRSLEVSIHYSIEGKLKTIETTHDVKRNTKYANLLQYNFI